MNWRIVGAVCLVVLLSPVAVMAAQSRSSTGHLVGPGIAEDTVRQVIRTSSGIVYVFAPDDTAQREGTGPGVLRAYVGNTRGVPAAFHEVDAGHRPSSSGSQVLYAPDVRLDRHGVAHLVYVDKANDRLYYQTFSTTSNAWGPRRILGGGAVANPGFYASRANVYRNWASYGLLLDKRDRPYVVYCSGNAVLARSLGAGGWSSPTHIATGRSPLHVQLAASAAFRVHAVWLDDPLGAPGATSVMYARREINGSWTTPSAIDHGSPNVLSNTTDDQSPSVVVTNTGTPYVMYLSGTLDSAGKAVSTATARYLRNGQWLDDTPPSRDYGVTHSPQLYSRRSDVYLFLGHDAAIHWGYLQQHAGGAWSTYRLLDASKATDGSVTVRWDPSRDHGPNLIDAVHHAEDAQGDRTYRPELYYEAVRP